MFWSTQVSKASDRIKSLSLKDGFSRYDQNNLQYFDLQRQDSRFLWPYYQLRFDWLKANSFSYQPQNLDGDKAFGALSTLDSMFRLKDYQPFVELLQKDPYLELLSHLLQAENKTDISSSLTALMSQLYADEDVKRVISTANIEYKAKKHHLLHGTDSDLVLASNIIGFGLVLFLAALLMSFISLNPFVLGVAATGLIVYAIGAILDMKCRDIIANATPLGNADKYIQGNTFFSAASPISNEEQKPAAISEHDERDGKLSNAA